MDKFKDYDGHIAIGRGIKERAEQWIISGGFKNVLVVWDVNTKAASGIDFGFKNLLFTDTKLKADEAAISKLTAAMDDKTDLLFAIGSGTITDLCKYAAHENNIQCAVFATAPSMDGYAAKGAAMTLKGMKVTPQTICPSAIFCDTDILRAAPMEMLASGLGDMLGKYTALADWKLSGLLTGEPVPEEIYGMMNEALQLCVGSARDLADRDAEAVMHLTEGLLLSGIAMSLYNDSRPASGTEHHLSHYWEMRLMQEGIAPKAHGLSVAVGAVTALFLYQNYRCSGAASAERIYPLCGCRPPGLDPQPLRPSGRALDRNRVLALVKEKYGPSAADVLKTENPNLPADFIRAKQDEILNIAEELPKPEEIAELLKAVGFNPRPSEIGVSAELLKEGIILARERKKVYTILQLLGDLGLLEEFSEKAACFFSKNMLN